MLLEGFIFGGIFLLMSGVRGETEVVVEVGSQAVLPCKCNTRTCHPAAITWSKDKKQTVWRKQSSGLEFTGSNWVENGDQRVRCPHSEFIRGDYSLQINNVKEKDGGVYFCRVEFRGHVTETQVTLRIIQVSVSPSAPIWGDSVSVTCSVTPWPEGAYVRWMLNNSPLLLKTGSILNKQGSVVNDKATEKQTGNWTCIFISEKQWQISTMLSVKGIIQPPKDDLKLYAAVGSSVTLPCVFATGLSPTATVFEKTDAGKNLILSNSFQRGNSLDKSFTFREVAFEEQGVYRCAGTVQGRRISRAMQLVVAKIVKTSKKNSVTLTCQLSDASEVTKYEWIHVTYDLNNTRSERVVQTGQTISLKEDGGEWTCRYGREGILGNVTTQVQLMSGLSGQKSSDFRNTGAVIGLSFLLIVLLLILAQMYKNHQRRKRIFQYPALETIVHTVSNEREERERNQVKE